MENYATEEYVQQELDKAGINFYYVDEVVAYFGKHGDEWKTYLTMLDKKRLNP